MTKPLYIYKLANMPQKRRWSNLTQECILSSQGSHTFSLGTCCCCCCLFVFLGRACVRAHPCTTGDAQYRPTQEGREYNDIKQESMYKNRMIHSYRKSSQHDKFNAKYLGFAILSRISTSLLISSLLFGGSLISVITSLPAYFLPFVELFPATFLSLSFLPSFLVPYFLCLRSF